MDPLVHALLNPAAYDHPVAEVRLIETHISWVFLTGPFAYKLKKPVNLGFVDFSSPEQRRCCCEEELRLNRRLAAELYLAVRDIHGPAERAHLGEGGEVIDAVVQMRQFEQEELLPVVLGRGALRPAHLDALAEDLARFHSEAAPAGPNDAWGDPAMVLAPAIANLDTLARLGCASADGEALRDWTVREHGRLEPLLEARRRDRKIRECHGDLHLGNMALRGDRIAVFDCLEFNPSLRWIDPISDLAFLVMDLRERGQDLLALRLLDRWLECSGDHSGLPLLPWYLAYRALVRAKVTGLRLSQMTDTNQAWADQQRSLESYLAQARASMAPGRGALLITHGISGSGKSHAARALRDQGWLHLRSDVERLRLFGRWGCTPPQPPAAEALGTDPYAPAVSDVLYGTVLLAAAEGALAAGLSVVVDATFLLRQQRRVFHDLARRRGARFGILACHATEAVALERIRWRQTQTTDPSEADGSVVRQQVQILEPLDGSERAWVVAAQDPKLANLGGGLEPA